MILLKYLHVYTDLTKSITFGVRVDSLAQKGKGKRIWSCFPLVLAFLLTQCKGKIYKVMNDQISGVQTDPTLINSLPTDEMAGRSEHFYHDC